MSKKKTTSSEQSKNSRSEEYVSSLISISKQDKNVSSYIATKILEMLQNGEKFTKAIDFAKTIGVSNSALTFFVKKTNLTNFKEIIFVHNLLIDFKSNTEKVDYGDSIYKAAKILNSANKIFLVGVSSSVGFNYDFYLKLLRMDKHCILVWNKYEQIGLSHILNENDVIIVNSISLQHLWMIEIIKKTKAKVILISSWIPEEIKNKVKFYFKVDSNEKNDGLRLYSMKSRIASAEIFYKIYDCMKSMGDNLEKIKLTSYRQE